MVTVAGTFMVHCMWPHWVTMVTGLQNWVVFKMQDL